jgi:hypothetical protein
MAMDSNGGDAKLTLQADYHGWQFALEIPNISAATLPTKLENIIGALEKMGCKPATPPSVSTAPAAAPAESGPPICKYHGPMKPSKKHGGWYCPQKMGDGSYCQEKVEG